MLSAEADGTDLEAGSAKGSPFHGHRYAPFNCVARRFSTGLAVSSSEGWV
jgi:hypothetical protein